MQMPFALLILVALAASAAATEEPKGHVYDPIDELRGWCVQGIVSNPLAKGPHLSRRQCQREVRSAERAIKEQSRRHGNISVNMSACIFYCEARFPGMAPYVR
jgi:hypothetical protein